MKIYIRNVEQVSQFSAVRDESVALLGRDILLRYRNILAQNRYQQLPYMVGGLVLRKTKNEKQDWWAAYIYFIFKFQNISKIILTSPYIAKKKSFLFLLLVYKKVTFFSFF